MIELKNVSLVKERSTILQNLTLSIRPSRFISIIGRNGAGKSSLLSVLSGEELNYAGEVKVFGQDLRHIPIGDLAKFRAILPQQHIAGFSFSVEEVIELGAFPHSKSEDIVAEKTSEIIRLLSLEKLRSRNIQSLSGGERQKVHFARTLLQVFLSDHPSPFLLLDEPANNLDLSCQQEIFELLKELCNAEKLTVIAIVHDINLAARYSDDFIFLKAGQLLECSPAEQCLKADILENALGHPVDVIYHPCSTCPLIVPKSKLINV